MQKRQLGRDGPFVGAVALGTMNFVDTYGPAEDKESLRCMSESLEMGVNHLDTSNVYGMGRAEDLLAQFLKKNRDRVVLSSKAGITRNPDHPFDNSPEFLQKALEGSLRRLGTDHIDLYYLHRREAARPIETVMHTLLRFQQEGKIGAIGLSEIAPSTLERARSVAPVAAVQSEYSLWTRLPELGMLQATQQAGTAFVAFSPIGRGVFTTLPPDPAQFDKHDFRRIMPRFDQRNWPYNLARLKHFADYARDHGETPAALAIAWVLARAPHVIALPGTRRIEHMSENVRGASITLSPEQLAEIEAILPLGWAHGERYGEAMHRGPEQYC
ncbi:aldo/keto reductase [Paracoccus caeni]|uniref:Aldo/keto reductase n=1 Tax=Paracoccus caeni TaxID=657651 RepID=A0A934SCP1_9RHOB|nr:aldo/keto reductase [Paracoccus caeni]MBK4215487.1 aldo/keto reductase [Paracoccus caeni]